MIDKSKLVVGLQVVFIPSHVHEECSNVMAKMLKHKDTSFGFVSSWKYSDHLSRNEMNNYLFPTVFCRYWNKDHPTVLRTMSCSEGCDPIDLLQHDSRTQQIMEMTIDMLRADPERYGWIEQKDRADE